MAQYAEIVEIVAPAKAAAGSRVDIVIRIRNKYTATVLVMAGGALEYLAYTVIPWPKITIPSDTADIPAGGTCDFAGYFTMPDSWVILHGYSYFYSPAHYAFIPDDHVQKVIESTVPPVPQPQFSEFAISDYRVT